MNTIADLIIGKKVLVFGLGRQGGGTGDAEWLKKHGAVVRVSDKDLSLVAEGQTQEQVEWAEIIIKNPAVPDDNELIKFALSLDKPVYTSVALFVKYTSLTTIGITGTRGKSTTVALITAMLEASSPGAVISGGNIAGTSCLALFDQQEGKQYAVLELSSFQLHNFHDLQVSPTVAIITNLYPDHLNRYPSMSAYAEDKEAICKYQKKSDICLYNADNKGAAQISEASLGMRIPFSADDCRDWETKLLGEHNKENIAALFGLTKALKLDESIARQVVRDFAGLPFRLETIALVSGVRFVNDTTATTPTAAIFALRSMTVPTIWITGGADKKLPYDELLKEVEKNEHIKKIIILGGRDIPEYIEGLRKIAGDKVESTVFSMTDAINLARKISSSGDTVLLSPGFTSFDLFKNEFDRGRQFNETVHLL